MIDAFRAALGSMKAKCRLELRSGAEGSDLGPAMTRTSLSFAMIRSASGTRCATILRERFMGPAKLVAGSIVTYKVRSLRCKQRHDSPSAGVTSKGKVAA